MKSPLFSLSERKSNTQIDVLCMSNEIAIKLGKKGFVKLKYCVYNKAYYFLIRTVTRNSF